MPSPNTFSIPPISDLMDRWLSGCTLVVDPFARAAGRGSITNDLDPTTPAQYHMEAEQFCAYLLASGRLSPARLAHAVLFDPPYSPRQISESYRAAGLRVGRAHTQNGRFYKAVRDGLDVLLDDGGIAISCGWNSSGFGKTRGYAIEEILIVAHGGAHNDTIVTVERKAPKA
jgi:hypothetical protein